MGRFPGQLWFPAEEMVAAIDIAVGEDHQRVAKADQSVEVFTGGVHSQDPVVVVGALQGPAALFGLDARFGYSKSLIGKKADLHQFIGRGYLAARPEAGPLQPFPVAQQVGAGGLAVKRLKIVAAQLGGQGAVGLPLAGEKGKKQKE